jgi:site-specific recombinase XerD
MAKSGVAGVFEREPGTNTWWIRWTDHQGKRHLEKIGRKGDAITMIGKRRADSHLYKKMPEAFRGGVTFGELARDAIKHSTEENGERSTHELKLKFGYILPDFERRPAASIKKQDITDWLQTMGEKREWSAATRNRYWAAFSLIFRVGLQNDKIESNPASKIKRKKEDSGRTRFLSGEEEQLLLELLSRRFPLHVHAFTISVHTGMRASEQWRLEWRDVNLAQKIVEVRQLSNTKSGRKIPLNTPAVRAFTALREAYPHPPKRIDPVFLNSDGGRLRGHRDWFDPILSESGLGDYTWHCNRHTFASRLVMAGVNLRSVQELTGHQSLTMVARYSHLAPGHNQSAVELIASRDWSTLGSSQISVATQSATSKNAEVG